MAQRSYVPRFGSWDKDNVPYTEYFENARKDKSGLKINPNDPQENPEAFGYGIGGGGAMENDSDFSVVKTPLHPMSSNRSDRKSDYYKTGLAAGGVSKSHSTSSNLSHRRTRGGNHPSESESHQRTASVPRFGAWDEADPKSGEGFTVIFERVKQEKHTASTTLPTAPLSQQFSSMDGESNQGRSSSPKLKFCCCPFSRRS